MFVLNRSKSPPNPFLKKGCNRNDHHALHLITMRLCTVLKAFKAGKHFAAKTLNDFLKFLP